MTTETNHTPATEPGNSWSGRTEPAHDAPPDPQAAPDEPPNPEPDQVEPESPAVAATQDGVTRPESTQGSAAARVGVHAGGDPLLTAEAASDLLDRWTEVQVSFVEDPHASVQDADALVGQIATTLLASVQQRRSQLAAGWQHGEPDTQALRLALRQYRSFIGVILPRQDPYIRPGTGTGNSNTP
jgi:hypothetical protein